jgi:hypothetical protein
MKKILVLTLLLFFCLLTPAQEKITDRMQRTAWGQGTVTIHQDEALYNLLGSYYNPDSKIQVKGYRIQIYAGGNTRESRDAANAAASTVRQAFPDLGVYTEFIAPRWLCRVGDYKTFEEADAQLREFKKQGLFRGATIIPNQLINVTF